MKRNCYLDLRLHSSSAYSPSHMNGTLNVHNKLNNERHNFFDMAEFQRDRTNLMGCAQEHFCLFVFMKLCTPWCTCIYLSKARVIIWSASREMEESTGLQSQALLMNVSQGLSIKKSLHNFLQKRKKRSQSHSSIVAHNVKN